MNPRASFRSQLMIGSLLWTLGVLVATSVLLVLFLSHHPVPHRIVLGWVIGAPMAGSLGLSALLMGVGAWQIRRSLAGIGRLRDRLTALHRGQERQIEGHYPAEVQPLVDDLNTLLAERDRRVQRALDTAGDLAHGLKTPLAVLARDADQVQAAGATELAASIGAQIARMQQQIDYHLAHARAAAASRAPGVRTAVAPCVGALLRTLQRLYAERALAFDAEVAASDEVRCQRQDLDEMLGNLLDNACKWARSRVRLTSLRTDGSIVLSVEDDGPGIPETLLGELPRRGWRADEQVPGSGLGLAIAADLAEIYGGSVSISRSPIGGVCARLTLPAADR